MNKVEIKTKEDICNLLEEIGFNPQSIKEHSTQIFVKGNLVVCVEDNSNRITCEGSCCSNGKGWKKFE
jgi:hypothetical protein